jgi:hypothetical protein
VVSILGVSLTSILILASEIVVNRVLIVILLLRDKLILLYYLAGLLFDIYCKSQPSNSTLV